MGQLQLLKTRRFAPLFLTQFSGAFNDNFLKNALIILVTFRSAQVMGIPPAEMVPFASGIFILPFFLFSATAGQLADKFEKGKIIRVIKICEIAIMLIAGYGFIAEQFPVLLLALFLMGLHSTFFGPLKFSILPQHLEPDELVGGNALIGAGTFLSILLGTIVGGELIAIQGSGAYWVSGLLLAIAVAGFAASCFIPEAKAVAPDLKIQWNPITPTWEILNFSRGNQAVFLSMLGASWFWFFGAAMLSLFPPYCKELLHTNERVVTLFLACFSIGIGVGAMLCGKLSRRAIELGLVPLGSLGISLFSIDLYFAGRPHTFYAPLPEGAGALAFLQNTGGLHVLIDLVMISVFSGFFIVPLYALIQRRSEPSHRSRIIAANNILNSLFVVAQALILPLLMRLGLTIPQIFLVLAAMNAAVAVYIYLLLPEFLLRFIAWIIANLLYRMKVEDEEKVPESGPALLVCNHVSFVDWLIIGAGIHRPVRFVMHYKFAQGAFGRWMMRRGKVIPIASFKEDPAILEAAFESVAKELERGELVCIFPEGQITQDGNLNVFKPGVEKIIQRTPVPVIPLALKGMWGSYFSRQKGRAMKGLPKRIWFRVHLKVSDPVPPEKVTAPMLQQQVQKMLA